MKEVVILIWSMLTLVGGFLLLWSMKYHKRQMGKYVMYHKLILVLLSFGLSVSLYYFLVDSIHLIWVLRLSVLCLGVLHVWVMYRQKWTKRDAFEFEKDAFLPEFIFTTVSALFCSLSFVSAPQIVGLVAYKIDVSSLLWDLPIVFVLPFLVLKLSDLASQIPYRLVENPWLFPIEPVNAESWPWRDLMQVNFQVSSSLLEEYRLFKSSARPWIEAPKEIALGNVFRLAMQERRRRRELTTIQDLGDEYDGQPKFLWLFSVKFIWWNPTTWRRKPRYLNPALSIIENKIRKQDIIVAKRIPALPNTTPDRRYSEMADYDKDKTVLLNR